MFKGSYKTTDSLGSPLKYFKGDSVLFHGKIFEAIKPTLYSPVEDKDSWEFKGMTEMYESENPPLDPVVGQLWSSNGRYYSYYYDGNNYSWIQV